MIDLLVSKMRKRLSNAATGATLAVCVAMILTLGGCAQKHKTMVEANPVTVIVKPTRTNSVADVKAVWEGHELVVSGKVESLHRFLLPGHVDISACSPEGNLLGQAQPRITGHTSKLGGSKKARFRARLPIVAYPGTILYLRYRTPGAQEADLSCH